MHFEVLHGITDCLWVKGEPVMGLKERVERETGMPTEIETYDWLVFLDMADGGGAYNRYYGRLSDGSIKTRGLMANRHDSPPYVKRMQSDVLEVMREAGTLEGLVGMEARAKEVRDRYMAGLRRADVKDLVVSHRIGQLEYGKNCAQASAIRAYGKLGVDLSAGMVIGYVVRDSKRWIVDAEWDAGEFDASYYGRLLEKAWSEMSFAFECLRGKNFTKYSNLLKTNRPAG
jgi:DNA polymerase I